MPPRPRARDDLEALDLALVRPGGLDAVRPPARRELRGRVIRRPLLDDIGQQLPALKAKILNEIALQLCDRLRQANIEISALRN